MSMTTDETSDTESFVELLTEALWSAGEEQGMDLTTRTYSEAGLLMRDDGLVVRIGDREFQVTVVQSR